MKTFLKQKSSCIIYFYLKTFFKFHSFSSSLKRKTLFKPTHHISRNINNKILQDFNTTIKKPHSNISEPNLNNNLNLFLENSKINMYKGVEIDLEKFCDKITVLQTSDHFDNIISHSLTEWEQLSMRSITIKIPKHLSNFILNFIKFNFYFHHTTEDSVTVCKWLDGTTPNKIPKFAHHHIGIGACIFNHNMEILMIRERYSTMNKTKNQPLWKLVTGLVEDGESIIEATLRESKEEVNMDVDYHGLVMITERFPAKFNLTDLCFFSLCSVDSKDDEDSKEIKIDTTELTEAKFFSIKEVEDIMREKMCTQATEITLRKVMELMDFEMGFVENFRKIREGRSLMSVREFKDRNLKFLNMFL